MSPEATRLRQRAGGQKRRLALGPRAVVALYLLGLAAAEALSTYGDARLGVGAHVGLLALLLVHAASAGPGPLQRLLLALSLAPLVRITSLSLPLGQVPLVYWYLFSAVPIMAAAVTVARLLGLSWRELGLSFGAWRLQAAVGLTGFLFGLLEYGILQPQPLAGSFTWQALWVPVLVLVVATGFVEEFAFRGVMQRALVGALGKLGLIYVALAFALLHLGYKSILDLIFVLVVGLFFGWIVLRTGSILGVTLSHALTNITLFLLVPFLVVPWLEQSGMPIKLALSPGGPAPSLEAALPAPGGGGPPPAVAAALPVIASPSLSLRACPERSEGINSAKRPPAPHPASGIASGQPGWHHNDPAMPPPSLVLLGVAVGKIAVGAEEALA